MKSYFRHSLVFLALYIIFCASAKEVTAVTPVPLPTISTSVTPAIDATIIYDCKNLASAYSGPVGDMFREYCRSLADSQAGYPYHTCRIIKDPVSSLVNSVFGAAKDAVEAMVPTVVAKTGVLDYIFGTPSNVTAVFGTTLNLLGNVFFIDGSSGTGAPSPHWGYPVRKAYDTQYYAGCYSGSVCVQALDLSSEGITSGDNLCVPTADFKSYLEEKKKGTSLAFILNKIFERKDKIYRTKSLSELCLRNTPNGDNITQYILVDKSPKAGTNATLASLSGLSNVMIMDEFHTNKESSEYIRRETSNIIKTLRASWRPSNTGIPVLAWKGGLLKTATTIEEYELTSLAKCIDAAHEEKLYTSLGNIPIDNLGNFISTTIFGILMGIAGAITLGCAIFSAVRIQISKGGEDYGKARETLMQCLSGLALIIFSLFALRFIGVDILRLPGLG